jgi:hypothetical protein
MASQSNPHGMQTHRHWYFIVAIAIIILVSGALAVLRIHEDDGWEVFQDAFSECSDFATGNPIRTITFAATVVLGGLLLDAAINGAKVKERLKEWKDKLLAPSALALITGIVVLFAYQVLISAPSRLKKAEIDRLDIEKSNIVAQAQSRASKNEQRHQRELANAREARPIVSDKELRQDFSVATQSIASLKIESEQLRREGEARSQFQSTIAEARAGSRKAFFKLRQIANGSNEYAAQARASISEIGLSLSHFRFSSGGTIIGGTSLIKNGQPITAGEMTVNELLSLFDNPTVSPDSYPQIRDWVRLKLVGEKDQLANAADVLRKSDSLRQCCAAAGALRIMYGDRVDFYDFEGWAKVCLTELANTK